MTKQELIIAAYGEHWDKVKDFVDENGWCSGFPNLDETYDYWLSDDFDLDYQEIYNERIKDCEIMCCRPKSLSGIELNNGWTRIVSHGEVSPSQVDVEVLYDVCDMESTDFQASIVRRTSFIEVFALFPEYATHWRIHKEEPKPLY